jgi:hypothetical protein
MSPRKKVTIAKDLTAKQLASVLDLNVTEVIRNLFQQGIMRTVHQIVELDTARKLARDMGYKLSDEDDPPDDQTAAVRKKPILPEGGNEASCPEPLPESEDSGE